MHCLPCLTGTAKLAQGLLLFQMHGMTTRTERVPRVLRTVKRNAAYLFYQREYFTLYVAQLSKMREMLSISNSSSREL